MRHGARFVPYLDAEAFVAWLERRFGIPPSTFAEFRFWQHPGSKRVWCARAECAPPDVPVEAFGIPAFRKPPPRGKPDTSFLLRFGRTATRNVYRLDAEDAVAFLQRLPLAMQPVDDASGYCLVWGPGRLIGAGRIKEGVLHSCLPTSWDREMDPESGW